MKPIALTVAFALLLGACAKTADDGEPAEDTLAAPTFSSTGLQTMPKAADGADGSGCLADDGELPDGAWFGFVTAWDPTGLDLDPACWFTGEEAAAQALARNDESPPPNDFYITNDSDVVRRIPAAENATALRVTHGTDGGVVTEETTFADLTVNSGTYQPCTGGDSCPVWVFVNGGVATEVTMQYRP